MEVTPPWSGPRMYNTSISPPHSPSKSDEDNEDNDDKESGIEEKNVERNEGSESE